MGKLYKKYGTLLLKRGSILYHASDNENFVNPNSRDKPLIFCTFHPSEWSKPKYVHYIKLERDVKLFFMISNVYDKWIESALPEIMHHHHRHPHYQKNLTKMFKNVQRRLRTRLEKEHYDGWFTSIENGRTVEVALFSGINIYSHIGYEKMKSKSWRNCNNSSGKSVYKKWGRVYKISFLKKRAQLYVNHRYKKMFLSHQRFTEKTIFNNAYIFQKLLNSARIKYH